MSKYGRRTKSHPDVSMMKKVDKDVWWDLCRSHIKILHRRSVVQVQVVECHNSVRFIRQTTNFMTQSKLNAMLVAMGQRDQCQYQDIIIERYRGELYHLSNNEECFEALFEIAEW